MRMARIRMYSTTWCGYCVRAKALLERRGLEYEEIVMDDDPAFRQKLLEMTGRWTVPQIFIDDVAIGGYTERVAVLDRHVRGVEELEVDVRDADPLERAPKGLRAEVEEPLVLLARVDVDRLQGAESVGVAGNHAHGIPREPPVPDFGNEARGRGVEREADRAVLVGGVARRHGPLVEEHVVGVLRDVRPRAEVLP